MIERAAEGLKEELGRWGSFEDCLLYDLRPHHYGLNLDVTFNYVWDDSGNIRSDVLESPRLIVVRLLRVLAVRFAGGLTASMIAEPDMVNWSLAEVSTVDVAEDQGVLTLSVLWHGSRRLDIDFVGFEVLQPPDGASS